MTSTVTRRPSGSPSSPRTFWIGRTRSGTSATTTRPRPTTRTIAAGNRLPLPGRRKRPHRQQDEERAPRTRPAIRSRLIGMSVRWVSHGDAAATRPTGGPRTGAADRHRMTGRECSRALRPSAPTSVCEQDVAAEVGAARAGRGDEQVVDVARGRGSAPRPAPPGSRKRTRAPRTSAVDAARKVRSSR